MNIAIEFVAIWGFPSGRNLVHLIQQDIAFDVGTKEGGLAELIDTMHGKNVLCEIDSDGDNGNSADDFSGEKCDRTNR